MRNQVQTPMFHGIHPSHVFTEGRRKSETPLNSHDPRTAVQLRTALKRLKEIMEGKSQVLKPAMHIHAKAHLHSTGLYIAHSSPHCRTRVGGAVSSFHPIPMEVNYIVLDVMSKRHWKGQL